VAFGIVLTVSDATNSVTYRVGGKALSLTPVDAHSRRWSFAPCPESTFQRSEDRAAAVGQPSIRQRGLPRQSAQIDSQGRIGVSNVPQPPVHFRVHTADEE
jgi:hypothetical protein